MKILLLGNSGSGKDFAADLFELSAYIYAYKKQKSQIRFKYKIKNALFNYKTKGYIFESLKKARFAQPVKDFIHNTFKIPYEVLNSSDKNNFHITIKGKDVTIRELIIKISEEFKNIFGENIWVDSLFKNYSKYKDIIIVDGRFPNEFEEAKKRGFITIKLNSFKENKTDFGLNKVNEIPEYKIDYVLENNDSQLSLFKKIYKIYESEIEKENCCS